MDWRDRTCGQSAPTMLFARARPIGLMPANGAPGRPGDVRCCAGFSDAGMMRPSTRCGGRRPRSAKARNRGRWAAAMQRTLWGFGRGARLEEIGAQSSTRSLFGERATVHAGVDASVERCMTIFAVRARTTLAVGRERGRCRRRAGVNGKGHCSCRLGVTAS